MSDPLVEAILADPDDDAARLVWADREGGERGELVVVQCELARLRRTDEASRVRLKKLLTRQTELLLLARGWSILEDDDRARFVRGFVDHGFVRPDKLGTEEAITRLFERAPLLRSLDFGEVDRDHLVDETATAITHMFERLPPGRIRAVSLRHVSASGSVFIDPIASTPAGAVLEELNPPFRIDATTLPVLRPFTALTSLSATIAVRVAALNAALPRLTRLYATMHADAASMVEEVAATGLASRLKELSFFQGTIGDRTAHAIARVPFEKLDELSVGGGSLTDAGVRALAEAPALARITTLNLWTNVLTTDAVAALAQASFAPTLRVLRLSDSKLTAAAIPHLLSFPALERLIVQTALPDKLLPALDEVIPYVGR